MAARDLIFCGTPPVGALNMLGLLESPMHAIWYPPEARRLRPAAGDKVWVVWKEKPDGAAILLGCGRLRATPQGDILWTDRTAPGIRDLAREFGYHGPSKMAFLRLERPKIAPGNASVSGLEAVPSGLSEATEAQRALLDRVLPVPA